MPFEWKEYWHLALALCRQEMPDYESEAPARCAVSRAYYAAFCHARNYARDQHGFRPAYADSDHRDIRDHFRERHKTAIANRLEQLRQWRNNCDYEDSVSSLSKLSSSAISTAGKILQELT